MSWRTCVNSVRQASGRDLSEEEVITIMEEVQKRFRQKMARMGDRAKAARAAALEISAEARVAAMLEKRSAAINVLRHQELTARRVEGKEVETIRAILTGVEGKERGMALSVDAQRHAIRDAILGPMLVDLRKAGVLDVLKVRDKAFERDVARELWRLEDPESGAATKNESARKTAEILHKYQEVSRAQRNEAGAWIGKLDHYITRQSHDMMKVRGNGSPEAFTAWADYILPRLDAERTFAGMEPAEVNKFLRNVWGALASGIHDSSTSDALAGFKGPGNLAKKVSQERKLHFKDADSWFDYNEKFGKGAVLDSISHGIEKGARDTALMRTFGTNPEAMFDRVVKEWAVDARDRGDTALANAIESDTWNKKIFKVITGADSIPGNATLAKYAMWNRSIEQMAKLGGAVITSITDLASTAAVLKHNGIPLWQGYTNQIMALLPKGADRQNVISSVGAGYEGILSRVIRRFSAEDGATGAMSKAVDVFHKLSLQSWWTDAMKGGVGDALSHSTAMRSGQTFAELPRRLQNALRRYGIEAAEWDVVRAAEQVEADGRNYIRPSEIGDAAVRDKYQTYITDQIREGMSEPTAGIRAQVMRGTQVGTVNGEIVRAIMQFKTFTFSFMGRSLMREFRRDGVDVGGAASMIAGMWVLGYVAMTLKELAKGRNPRIPEDAEGWAKLLTAALVQGGGLGLYGDFLFGDNNRFGGGIIGSLAGPTAGNVEAVAKMISDFRDGSHTRSRWQVLGSDGLKLARDNTPFVNLFYTQAALNYLVIYRLQEALNPGYLRRYEAGVKRENNQTFWLHPSRAPEMAKPDVPSIFGGPR